MILEQTMKTVSAGAAVAAAVIVSVVAAAFTVYALVVNQIGPAGASAVVAALFAALAGLVALIATRRAAPKRADEREAVAGLDLRAFGLEGLDLSGTNLVDRASEMIKERPVVAAGAAVAIGLIAFRNPELVTMLARAILAPGTGSGPPDEDRPRR
jgi:hypothetical protein